MLRRVRRGWLRRAIKFMRWSRMAAYLSIALAGVSAIATPPASVAEATGPGHIVQIMWAVLMVVSAGFCAYGAATDRWVGEYIGLIPLSTVAAVYGLSALARGRVGWTGGIFLLGFFWLLVSRWQEVALARVESARIDDRYRRGAPGTPVPDRPEGHT